MKSFFTRVPNRQLLIIFFCLACISLTIPELAFASANLQSSVNSLSESAEKIGLAAIVLCLIGGGTMTAFGNQKGPMVISGSILGGFIILTAPAIVSLLQSSVN